jgi:hypothetical protein
MMRFWVPANVSFTVSSAGAIDGESGKTVSGSTPTVTVADLASGAGAGGSAVPLLVGEDTGDGAGANFGSLVVPVVVTATARPVTSKVPITASAIAPRVVLGLADDELFFESGDVVIGSLYDFRPEKVRSRKAMTATIRTTAPTQSKKFSDGTTPPVMKAATAIITIMSTGKDMGIFSKR